MRYREMRLMCDYDVAVEAAGRRLRGTITNVCSMGARLSGVGALERGTRVVLELRLTRPRGAVVWCSGGVCGLRFDRPLSKAELAQIRGHLHGRAPAPAMRPASHGFREL